MINKNKTEVSLVEMLELANTALMGDPSFKDIDEALEFNYYKKIICSMNDKKLIRRGLQKDATASFIQNLIRLMGPKNEQSLLYANLISVED